ncbi:MAG: HNH endonuclease, partial [Acidimicrobiaceae bacterium]|nr:HNH endonuclease [Acidimicrobiaceae bacterium]
DPVTGRRIRNRLNRDAHRLFDADKRHARGLHSADEGHARAGGETRSLKQCMADALDHMTRITAGGGKPFADIALVVRLDPDTEKLMVSTADGDPLPASVIGSLAGESSWFGLVLSAKGVPMWKGRNVRRATESQFQALMALYGGCAGCGEPDENKVHAHHMDPFARGGGTDLDNLIPLCWGCHANIHDHQWQVVGVGDGKHTIRPPDRIHHGAARLPDTAPLFALTEQGADAGSGAAALFDPTGRSADAATCSVSGSGCRESSSAESGDGGWTGAGAMSGGGSRAGPSGPQAARAALRRARAAQHDIQAVRS